MRDHGHLDIRALALAREVARRIDADARREGLDRARRTVNRWRSGPHPVAVDEWAAILDGPWERVRDVLLDETENGIRLRQSSPFCGVLSPRERWAFLKRYSSGEQGAA